GVGGPGGQDPSGGSTDLPRVLRVYPAAPNPIRTQATIAVDLPEPHRVDLQIFDVNGSLVRALGIGSLPPGHHILRWNADDAQGRTVSAGVYLARIRVLGALSNTQKLVVMP